MRLSSFSTPTRFILSIILSSFSKPKRFILTIFLSIYCTTLSALAMEETVLVSLFHSSKPVTHIYVVGPAKIIARAEEKLESGLYDVSKTGTKFIVVGLHHPAGKSHTREIPGDELKLLPTGRPLQLGADRKKLRRYRGEVKISAASRAQGAVLNCQNLVAMKDYINSVVGSETPIEFPKEALKAQSVIVQTRMQRYKIGDDLNDSTEKQVYFGIDNERKIVIDAVQESWGQKLTFAGKPVTAFFHSCCAGGTSSSSYFTGKPISQACDIGVKCNHCNRSMFWKETKHRIPLNQYLKEFKEGVPTISKRDSLGRPLRIKYPSYKEEQAYDFWIRFGQAFGWDKIPGTRFEIQKVNEAEIEVTSRGAGHGVGFCQWGACGLAAQHKNYKEILQFYFPASKI